MDYGKMGILDNSHNWILDNINMKLKTLKDLDFICSTPCADSIKEEAIKWVEYSKERNHQNVLDWIKHFFNITEDDLNAK